MYEMMWPREDADFKKCDRQSQFCIELYGTGGYPVSFFEYSQKFFEAAHIVTEYILESSQIGILDNYFFPVAYMYRHSLELILKAIAFKYISNETEFIKDTFHNLVEILNQIEPYIQGEIDSEREAYRWIKDFLTDMELIDKESDAFRYPFKICVERDDVSKVKEYLIKKFFDGQKHINLRKFANKMEATYEMLCSYYNKEHKSFEEYKSYKPIFLEEGGEYYTQSVIGYDYHRDMYGPMVKGYSETGKCLADYYKEKPSKREILFLPMCYLYRNALELELKQIWFEECGASRQERLKKLNRCKHSFKKMWNMINEDLLHHSQGQEDISVISHAERYICQLHDFDLTSSIFRYPTDKGMQYHFKNRCYLDAKNVADFMEEISQFLQAVDDMMNDHNQIIAEMAAECESN